ncbi:MAG: hypothetical protein KA052_00575 [Candidatus Pacebacteria bacterium]|nr:hypothetical protein [Candidatus Paceibacterota bacterium]
MEHNILLDFVLMVLGSLGLSLAAFIYHKKCQKKPLICPMRASCDFVTSSSYSHFCGCRVEVLGICYYSTVIILHAAVAFFPAIFDLTIARAALFFSASAFLFSIYLISIQAFVLKQWCTWCIFSALLCVAIFVVTYFSSPAGVLWW